MTPEQVNDSLHDAVWSGDLPRTRALVRMGGDVSSTDMRQWTPLHIAAHRGDFRMVHFLLGEGADPEKREMHGCTPALLASEKDHAGVVMLLGHARRIFDKTLVRKRLKDAFLKPEEQQRLRDNFRVFHDGLDARQAPVKKKLKLKNKKKLQPK